MLSHRSNRFTMFRGVGALVLTLILGASLFPAEARTGGNGQLTSGVTKTKYGYTCPAIYPNCGVHKLRRMFPPKNKN